MERNYEGGYAIEGAVFFYMGMVKGFAFGKIFGADWSLCARHFPTCTQWLELRMLL